LSKGEMDTLTFELERALRDIRGEQAPLEDLVAIQARSRKIQRLNGALMMLRTFRQKARI